MGLETNLQGKLNELNKIMQQCFTIHISSNYFKLVLEQENNNYEVLFYANNINSIIKHINQLITKELLKDYKKNENE